MGQGYYLKWRWKRTADNKWVEEKEAIARWVYEPVCDYALELRESYGGGPAFADERLQRRVL